MKNFVFFLLLTFSCSSKKSPVDNPPGYDLQSPAIVKLPLQLDEISGLSYYTKDKSVFAISDEKEFLFKITAYPSLQIKTWKFSGIADFEDIVLLDSTFYILQSNGNMHIVNFASGTVSTREIKFLFTGKMEFEAMFYDSTAGKLLIVCKDCEDDKKKQMSMYSFDPQQNAFTDSVTSLDVSPLFKKKKEKSFHFKASAAAVHPLTGELYVISAINSLLIIFDKNRLIKSFHTLNTGNFKQPEGMTFTENGTMIISNESAQAGVANLLLFTYNK